MDGVYIAAQVLGFVIAAENFFVYFGNNRSRILAAKLVSDTLYAVQYAMLGALTGAVLNVLAVFREIIFYNRDRYRWASSLLWPILFVLLMGLSPVLTWAGPISLLPAAGSALAVVAFYMRRPTHTRIIGVFAQLLWLIYSVYTVNYGAILCNVVLIVSALTGLACDLHRRRKQKALPDTSDAAAAADPPSAAGDGEPTDQQ